MAAAHGISSRAGDQLSDLLEPMVSLEKPRMEDLSTEEVLAQLEEVQCAIMKSRRRDTMVGSLDVKGLYPSLDQDGAAEAVAQFVLESPVELPGIDWRHAQIFVASNMSVDELKRGVLKLVPRRLKRKGNRPGPTTTELRQKKVNPAGVDNKLEGDDQTDQAEDPGPRVRSKWSDTNLRRGSYCPWW